MNIDERIVAIRAGHVTQEQPKPVAKKFRREQIETEVSVKPALSTEMVFDIANNSIAKLMQRDDLSDKGKLEAVVELLSVKEDNYHSAEKTFAEFEAYFEYQQSQRTRVSEQNIQRLTVELEDGTKASIEQILTAFSTVNHGVGNIKQLVTVMEKARIDGRTMEVLTAAYRMNEALLKYIAAGRKVLDDHKRQEKAATDMQAHEIDEKREHDEGLVSRVLQFLFYEDRSDQSLELNAWRLQTIQEKVEILEKALAKKEQQRDHQLEDGELTILRTIDATEGGFTDQVVTTARDSLALIRSTRASIEALLAANARSRAASVDIANSLQDSTGSEATLKGALQVVASDTHHQVEGLEQDVDRLTGERTAAADDHAEAALITVNRDKAGKNAQDGLTYEQTIKTKVVSFELLASSHVQAEARAKQFAALVDSHHELLVNLQQQALPITANALEMGLQQGVALRDGLLAAGVRDATSKAEKVFGENLDGATEAQGRFETEKLEQMRAAIAALGTAQKLISERTDKAIEHGLASMELVETVRSSAEGVRTAMTDFQKVGAVLAGPNTNDDREAEKPTPAAPVPNGPEAAPPEQR